MNKEEAKEAIENLYCKTVEIYKHEVTMVPKYDVLEIIDELDQPKPVVPKFVADWIEKYKKELCRLSHALEHVFDDVELSLYIKQREDDYTEIIAKAWLYGYTVQKEKLYTVEIPNPNRNSKGCAKFRLEKLGDKVYLVKRKSKDVYQNKDSQKLTEAEIRKDFDWAWEQGFAEEVTE